MTTNREEAVKLPTPSEVKEALFIKSNVPIGCLDDHNKTNGWIYAIAQAYAEGKLVEPMGREEIILTMSEHHSGNRAEAEKIADALLGKVGRRGVYDQQRTGEHYETKD